MLNIRDKECKVCLLDIDVKGARDIHDSKLVDCNYLFVKTPTLADLEKRLLARKTETPETLKRRLANAEAEERFAEQSGLFQRILVNDKAEEFIKEAEVFVVKDLYHLDV